MAGAERIRHEQLEDKGALELCGVDLLGQAEGGAEAEALMALRHPRSKSVFVHMKSPTLMTTTTKIHQKCALPLPIVFASTAFTFPSITALHNAVR